jgi:hypothetical protein
LSLHGTVRFASGLRDCLSHTIGFTLLRVVSRTDSQLCLNRKTNHVGEAIVPDAALQPLHRVGA